MSHYYRSYEEEDAYRNGRRDANYGRFDHMHDCRWGDDVDKAYCDGYREVEEERAEERRREEEEMERLERMRWEQRQELMRQQEEEEMRYYEEETERRHYEREMERQYKEYSDSNNPDYLPF